MQITDDQDKCQRMVYFLKHLLIISKATLTSSGSPGSFESMTPSGDIANISSAEVS